MNPKSHRAIRRCRCTQRRAGAVLVLAALLLTLLLIFTAFVVDIGYIVLRQGQLQIAVDATSLGAAMDFDDGEDAVNAMVNELLELNGFDAEANPRIDVATEFGTWDAEQLSFVTTPFEDADALQVSVTDESLPAFFGAVMGHSSYTVQADAIAGAKGGVALDVVLVMDCSTSMRARMGNGETRMDNALEAGIRLIDALSNDDRVGLAVFSWRDSERNRNDRTGIVETWLNDNQDPARNRLIELQAGEYVSRGLGTNIGGGLRAGLDPFLHDQRPRANAVEVERIMILLTDGQVNLAEPYPIPDDREDGVVPLPPFAQEYDPRVSVRRWGNTIRARGIKLFVVTLSDDAHDPLMVEIASPPDDLQQTYYYHVADGENDYLRLLEVFGEISNYGSALKLLQ